MNVMPPMMVIRFLGQGQTQGIKDQLIIDRKARDLELLVFYRTSKTEHPGAGFRDICDILLS